MNSMTGYGRGASSADSVQVVVEITTVNRKTLDLNVSLPREWQALEPGIAETARGALARGRVQISVQTEPAGEMGSDWFDAAAVEAGYRQLAELAQKLGSPISPDGPLLAAIAAATRSRPELPPAEGASAPVGEALAAALTELAAMRAREGQALQTDLRARAETVGGSVRDIGKIAPEVAPAHGELLRKRLRQAGLEIDLEDDRVLREIALFADRCDVSEELTRLESHFEQLAGFLGETGPVGRKLEFLLQEIGREFNTIGSKANDARITRLVIEAKNELERMREQVQNIE